eukprot:1012201-Alexandrium_andersonii.AAC.1
MAPGRLASRLRSTERRRKAQAKDPGRACPTPSWARPDLITSGGVPIMTGRSCAVSAPSQLTRDSGESTP